MTDAPSQSDDEAAVKSFRDHLGPFVVAAEKTRMPMVFTNVRPSYAIIFANDAFLALTGYSREDVLGRSLLSLVAKGSEADAHSALESALRGECKDDPETHWRRHNGTEFWASIFVSPVCDSQGTVVQKFVSLIDLFTHRSAAAHSKRLIDELNHRVKNTLSTVISIVGAALRRPAEPGAVREAIESRVLALSRSHDLLTSVNWEGAGLRDLVCTALQPFEAVDGHAGRFTVTGENVHLPPKTTLALAITLHELATNAVKYGAFSNVAGKIDISWTVVSDGSGLVLRWQEREGPRVTAPTHKGFGSWVIERGLAHELGGNVVLDYPERGVVCTIEIPTPAGMNA